MTTAAISNKYVAFIAESILGVTPALPELAAIPYRTESFNLTRPLISDPSVRGNRQKTAGRLGNKLVDGSFEVSYAPNTFDTFVDALFMSTPSSGVLKVGSTKKSFTFEVGHTDITKFRQYVGVNVSSMNMKLSNSNEIISATFNVMGIDGTTGSVSIDNSGGVTATALVLPYVALDATFKEGGVTIATLTNIDIALDNGLSANHVLGSAAAACISTSDFMAKGKITAHFADLALYNKFINETNSTLEFTLTSGSDSEIWFFPVVKYSGGKFTENGNSVFVELDFEATYDATTATTVRITRV